MWSCVYVLVGYGKGLSDGLSTSIEYTNSYVDVRK